ncbi:hypothetical protein CVS40_3905 [Lucilia cuprina]|nr:hypothetical protein CVS40_3905 [Lucilia cuprina]
MENLSERQMWLDAPIKLLISNLLVELQPKVGKSAALKNKKKLWDLISEELKSNGYMFTPIQVETKFRSLERQYKKTKLNNKLTGRSKMTCPYERSIDSLLAKKIKTLFQPLIYFSELAISLETKEEMFVAMVEFDVQLSKGLVPVVKYTIQEHDILNLPMRELILEY